MKGRLLMLCFRSFPFRFGFVCLFCSVTVVGCSRQEFKTASVSGTCKCNGVPMTAGLLILSPVQEKGSDEKKKTNIGKPARALIQPDGSFSMSTYGRNDGAVIGKHRVVLNLAELDEDDPVQPCTEVPEGLMVDVQPGSNTFEIDLGEE